MPNNAGTRFEPGRERERERKREEAADVVGVIEKRLDAHAAPSGELPVTGGMREAMTLFNGRARPRRPLKVEERGSFVTDAAAASA